MPAADDDDGAPVSRVRLRLDVAMDGRRRSLARVFDADDALDVVPRWLREEGETAAAERLETGDAELLDTTTHPSRALSVRAHPPATLHASGLWPAARLVARRAETCALRIVLPSSHPHGSSGPPETLPSETEDTASCTLIRVRPDAAVDDVARRALEALPVSVTKTAAAWTLAMDGRRLDPRETLVAQGVATTNTGATTTLVLTPSDEAAAQTTAPPQRGDDDPPPPADDDHSDRRPTRRTCRICYEEEEAEVSWDADPPPGDDAPGSTASLVGVAQRGLEALLCFAGPPTRQLDGARRDDARRRWRHASQGRRMISPCLCAGSMRYVHVDCLNAWRAAAPSQRSRFRCDQCGYAYRVRRTAWAAWLASDAGAAALSAVGLLAASYVVGCAVAAAVTERARRFVYDALWLSPAPTYNFGSSGRTPRRTTTLDRGGPHDYSMSSYASGKVWPIARVAPIARYHHHHRDRLVLGAASVGLVVLALSFLVDVRVAYLRHRLGERWTEALQPIVLFALWVGAETVDLHRLRALVVVGFLLAGLRAYVVVAPLARRAAARLGEHIENAS